MKTTTANNILATALHPNPQEAKAEDGLQHPQQSEMLWMSATCFQSRNDQQTAFTTGSAR